MLLTRYKIHNYICIVLIFLSITSCTTSKSYIDYTQYGISNTNISDTINTNIIAESSKRSFFWTSCDDLIKDVFTDLQHQAMAIGGDYISNIRFSSLEKDHAWITTPVCETGWGWAVLYVIPVFGPWVQVSSAKGEVVKNKEKQIAQIKNTATNISNIKAEISSSKCASRTIGDRDKLVCGDSKDRVLDKWGDPNSVSPTQEKWSYKACNLYFYSGKLINYGGVCELKKISNDSFDGDRI